MASPQPDKFTKISSELLEAFCRLQLSGSEWSFIHALIRKTYGYNKKEDWITNTQIMSLTGLGKERTSEAKKSLIAKGIVTEKRNKIGLQKDYEKWQELRKNVTKVTEKRNSELRKNVTTIDNTIEDNISELCSVPLKDNNQDMSFKNLRKYKEDGHWEEPSLDSDTLEEIEPLVEKEKTAERELNDKIRHNLKLVEEVRGLPFGSGQDMNYHVKIYRSLLGNGWSHKRLIEELIELINTDHWKEKKKLGQYPGMNTVQFNLRNQQPS